MNAASLKPLRSMILLFVLLNAFLITGKAWLAKKGIDQEVLIIGNLLLFAVMVLSFIITRRSFNHQNPNVFVRSIYTGFIIKFFILALGAFLYIIIAKKNVNKPAIFACMGLYIVYTFFEVSALWRLLKQNKNG